MLLVTPPATWRLDKGRLLTIGDGLTQQIDEDLSRLPELLPDGKLQHLDKHTRIVLWYRDRSIEQDEEQGSWMEKPLEPSAEHIVREPGPALINIQRLPLPVRPRAFHRGLFDSSPLPKGTTNVTRRNIEAKSGPTLGIPLRRKADGIPDGEGPRKLRCVVPEPRRSNPGQWDEFDHLPSMCLTGARNWQRQI